MINHPGSLVEAAIKSGMKVPDDPEEFDNEAFPYFAVFCNVQLCRPLVWWGEHWENAKVIAAFSEDEIKKATLADLIAKGLIYRTS